MVALVEEMISLHRLLAAARTDHERTNLKHRINAADRRIDRLIDDVYSNVAPVWAERTSWA
ncbi:MAG: hypothetical protein KJ936_08310 [Proteobacteria bacterium]|nr:hypothetical protein [Pseudomonadota bacterium]MBU2227655.1 hypothetical protein [Pseudomonadota bacterium]MBU2260751.1 hypothetical protein [Pseudomonadota bacterium]